MPRKATPWAEKRIVLRDDFWHGLCSEPLPCHPWEDEAALHHRYTNKNGLVQELLIHTVQRNVFKQVSSKVGRQHCEDLPICPGGPSLQPKGVWARLSAALPVRDDVCGERRVCPGLPPHLAKKVEPFLEPLSVYRASSNEVVEGFVSHTFWHLCSGMLFKMCFGMLFNIRSAAPVTQDHLPKTEDLMLQNAAPLRKSAPWPPNISEHVSCAAPATENASCQILFKCPTPAIVFGNATKPQRFAHFWQGAQSLAPATQNDIWTSKNGPSMWCF